MTMDSDGSATPLNGSSGKRGLVRTLKRVATYLLAMVIIFGGIFLYFTNKADNYARNGDWDSSLTDFNGVWRSDLGGQLVIYFDEKGSGQIFGNTDRLFTPKNINPDTGDVTVSQSLTTLKDIQENRRLKPAAAERGIDLLPDIDFQRVWDADHKTFTLVTVSRGVTSHYGFVRRLTGPEVQHFSDIKARAAAALEEDKAALAAEAVQRAPGATTAPESEGVSDGSNAKADSYYEREEDDKPGEKPKH